jgi:hypothetical protein
VNYLIYSSAALLAIECLYFFWLRERSWFRVLLPRQRIIFPPVCPSCLAATTEVECVEGSLSRTIGPTRKEFVTLRVPYCTACGTALNSDRSRAWKAVVVPVIVVIACSWMWGALGAPEKNDWFGIACLVGLPIVWPIYSIYSHRKRALCVRRYNQRVIDVRVLHSVYGEALQQLNTDVDK